MNPIIIVSGKGEGSNPLSAFDAALQDAGTADVNIIVLSSVIPPHSVVREEHVDIMPKHRGDLAYVVQAMDVATEQGTLAVAGLGWTQRSDGSGVFVEHHGSDPGEVKRLIIESLTELAQRRGGDFGKHNVKIVQATCTGKPVCVLVQAVYMLCDSRTGNFKEF